jgi:hypothetical protein
VDTAGTSPAAALSPAGAPLSGVGVVPVSDAAGGPSVEVDDEELPQPATKNAAARARARARSPAGEIVDMRASLGAL